MSVDVYIYLFDPQPYEGSLLPAYRTFVDKRDSGPLVKLLRDAIPQLGSVVTGYGEPGLSQQSYESYIATLTGKEYYSSQAKEPKEGDVTTPEDMRILVDNSIAPNLLEVFCISRNLGVNPEQSMSRRALMNYLYSQSRWIEDYFTGSKQRCQKSISVSGVNISPKRRLKRSIENCPEYSARPPSRCWQTALTTSARWSTPLLRILISD